MTGQADDEPAMESPAAMRERSIATTIMNTQARGWHLTCGTRRKPRVIR